MTGIFVKIKTESEPAFFPFSFFSIFKFSSKSIAAAVARQCPSAFLSAVLPEPVRGPIALLVALFINNRRSAGHTKGNYYQIWKLKIRTNGR